MPGMIYSHLKGFLSGVDELVALELGALDEGLPALGANVHPGAVRVQVLPHCAVSKGVFRLYLKALEQNRSLFQT